VLALPTTRVLLVLGLLVLMTAGCSRSDDRAAVETTEPTASETTPAPKFDKPPRSYRELMARLPPFDEPASPDVAAWRKATISEFFGRCVSGLGGVDKASFVVANRKLLREVALFPGAAFVKESSTARQDGNGCPDRSGPASYYVTYRTYRLPAGTKPVVVLNHYEGAFFGWVESRASGCERTYGQGPAFVVVNACNGALRVTVRARAPLEPTAAATAPPRPFGVQYPLAAHYLATPKPAAYGADPGETCERIHGTDVPSIIIPPSPGVRAAIRGKHVVVTWTLGLVHGDCPPSELVLGYAVETPHTIREPVHAASGVTRMAWSGSAPPSKLTAIAVSVDGIESRRVSVLIRQ
jgi:hypothetical protein